MYSFFINSEEIAISRESSKGRTQLIENELTRNINSNRKTDRSGQAAPEWPNSREDFLVRERAYRNFLIELKAELRQESSVRTADMKLLRELSAKNGVSFTWYLFRVAVPLLDDDLRKSSTNL